MTAELNAMLQGIKLCHSLSINISIAETDSHIFSDFRTARKRPPWPPAYAVHELQQSLPVAVSIVHVL